MAITTSTFTASGNRQPADRLRSPSLNRFLLAASATAIISALPGVIVPGAAAQNLPAQCVSDGPIGTIAAPGDNVTCLSDAVIDALFIDVDNVAVTAGNAELPAIFFSTETTVQLDSSGPLGQSFDLVNAGSQILGEDIAVVLSNSGEGGIDFVSEGEISGDTAGLVIGQNGAGAINASVADVRALAEDNDISAVVITASEGGGAVNFVSTGTISTNGIDAESAAIEIDTNVDATSDISLIVEDVVADNSNAEAISAQLLGVGDFTAIVNGEVTSVGDAFDVDHEGTGSIIITTNGAVTSTSGDGFDIDHNGVGDVVVTTNDIVRTLLEGGNEGIEVDHDGTGNIVVITNALVDAAQDGIETSHDGTGDIVLTANADVIAADNDGVEGSHNGDGSVLITTTGLVSAADNAIEANINSISSSGDIVIAAQGDLVGDSDGSNIGSGIEAEHAGLGDISIAADGAISGDIGIDATHEGQGDTTITATGPITASDVGILAQSFESGSLSISAESILAVNVGILADQSGEGDLSVQTLGRVASEGIALDVNHFGTGDTFIDAQGELSGTIGVLAAANGSLTISTADIDAEQTAISANLFGQGDLSITTSGDITSAESRGIDAEVFDDGNVRIVTDGLVSGLGDAIFVKNNGAGDTTIITNGDVIGGDEGIQAFGNDNGDILIIANGNVTGGTEIGQHGINADHDEIGNISVEAHGIVTAGDRGIEAEHSGVGDISVTTTGSVRGDFVGVFANHEGEGQVTLDISGDIEGGVEAIFVENVNRQVVVVDPEAEAPAPANTDVSITMSGSAIGDAGEGIFARQGTDGDLSIVATGDVIGAAEGNTDNVDAITAINDGTGSTFVDVAGLVDGRTSWGIDVTTVAGSEVFVRNGAVVTGPAGSVIDRSVDASMALTLEAGGTLDGRVFFLGGDDVFNDQGGSFTTAFGGDGNDTVNFSGAARTLVNSGGVDDSLQQFEVFTFNGEGITLEGVHQGLTQVSFNAGANVLDGTLEAALVEVAAGTSFTARDGSLIVGDFVNDGLLNVGNSPGTLTVDGDVTFGSNSVFVVEIDNTGFDQIISAGDVVLDGQLQTDISGSLNFGANDVRIIDANGVISGSFVDVDFENGLLISNDLILDEANADLILRTFLAAASDIDGLAENAANAGDALITTLTLDEVNDDLLTLITAIGAIDDAAVLNDALTQLTPEALDISARTVLAAQDSLLAAVRQNNRDAVSGEHNLWGAAERFSLDKDEDPEFQGFSGDADRLAFGVSGYQAGPVRLGAAVGYTSFDGEQDSSLADHVDGELFQLAASMEAPVTMLGTSGNLNVLVGVATGEQNLTMVTAEPISDRLTQQAASSDVSSVDAQAALSVALYKQGNLSIDPFVGVGVSSMEIDGFEIGEGQATALSVEDASFTRGEIAIGTTVSYAVADTLNAHARLAGVHYFGDTQHTFVSRFSEPTAFDGPFETNGEEVSSQFEFEGGLTTEIRPGGRLSVNSSAQLGTVSSVGLGLSFTQRF